jgi:hypothetical protein
MAPQARNRFAHMDWNRFRMRAGIPREMGILVAPAASCACIASLALL